MSRLAKINTLASRFFLGALAPTASAEARRAKAEAIWSCCLKSSASILHASAPIWVGHGGALGEMKVARDSATMSAAKASALIRFALGIPGHQRESPVVGRDAGDDGTADGALGCGGIEAACWLGDGGADDIFCLMSSSTACSVAMFCAICSCLAASCSTLRRTTSTLNAKGPSCCAASGELAAATGDDVVGTDNNQASVGTRAATIPLAASPWDCQASVAPTPMRAAIENRVRVRNIRLPIEGRSFATSSSPRLEEYGSSASWGHMPMR